jgi:hypothetical protein
MIHALCVAGLVVAAPAQPPTLRIAVVSLRGPRGQAATSAILASLNQVPGAEVIRAPSSIPAGSCGDSPCDLLLRGDVNRRGLVHLSAYAGGVGKPLDTLTLPLPRSGQSFRRAVSARLTTWVTRLVVPAPPPPDVPVAVAPAPLPPKAEIAPPPLEIGSPIASPPPPAVDERSQTVTAVVSSPPATAQRPFVDLSAGGGTLSRHLLYTSDLFGAFNNYQLNAGPVFSVGAEWYPIAHLGLIGGVEHTVALTSLSTTGLSLATNEGLYEGGLRARFFLGASEVGVSAKYGEQRFDFTQAGSAAPLPDYDYGFVEGAADGRLALGGRLSLLARAGYLQVITNSLKASGFFPRATVGGVDAAFGPAFAVADLFELRLVGDYRRFFFSMNPVPGDAHVAGGALDQYITAMLEGAVRFR